MKFLMIGEIFKVSSGLWIDIDSRFGEIFMMNSENAFAALSVVTVADLLQLSPVRGKLIFPRFSDRDSMKHLLGLQSWHLFKYAELTEVLRQNDKLFIDLLNKVRVVNIDDDLEKLLKTRFILESDVYISSTWEKKRCRTVGEKDGFHQNIYPKWKLQ